MIDTNSNDKDHLFGHLTGPKSTPVPESAQFNYLSDQGDPCDNTHFCGHGSGSTDFGVGWDPQFSRYC